MGGSQQLSIRMAKQLGSRVQLNAPVRQIRQEKGLCYVTSDKGTWRARQVIVAVPPAVSAFIDYDPILPFRPGPADPALGGQRDQVQAIYDTPFWRGRALRIRQLG